MTTLTPERPRPALVGPLLLIALGAVLLMNNMGLLSWEIWEVLFRLWPLLLIAFGLDLMIGRRSLWAAFLIPLLLLLAIGFAVVSFGSVWGRGAALDTTLIEQPIGNANSAEVVLDIGRGALFLSAMDTPAGLIAGSVHVAEGVRLQPDFAERDGVAHYRLQIDNAPQVSPLWDGTNSNERWDLQLNPALPMELTLNTGIGMTNLDLRELDLTELTIHSGVGAIDVTMPAVGRLRAVIDGGVGSTRVIIPEGVAARITITRGLGDIQVSDTYIADGDRYESADYERADNRIDLTINGGIGTISVIEE